MVLFISNAEQVKHAVEQIHYKLRLLSGDRLAEGYTAQAGDWRVSIKEDAFGECTLSLTAGEATLLQLAYEEVYSQGEEKIQNLFVSAYDDGLDIDAVAAAFTAE